MDTGYDRHTFAPSSCSQSSVGTVGNFDNERKDHFSDHYYSCNYLVGVPDNKII